MKVRTKRPNSRSRSILRGSATLVETPGQNLVHIRRHVVAEFCKTIGASLRGETASQLNPHPFPDLSPRMRQTLERLLAGDSEKQIAAHLSLSRNTVHVYVKALYKGFNVQSRGELLSKFVRLPPFQAPTPRPAARQDQ